MTNSEVVSIANVTDNNDLKSYLRSLFHAWCERNGRGLLSPNALMDWMKEEYAGDCSVISLEVM